MTKSRSDVGDRCPRCASTDISALADSDKAYCLDCNMEWTPGGRKRRGRYQTQRVIEGFAARSPHYDGRSPEVE